jgi:hypothetical protein
MAQEYGALTKALQILVRARAEVFADNFYQSTPASKFLLGAMGHISKHAEEVMRGTEAGA